MTTAPRPILNIYCDESCHLEASDSSVMVFGALTCPGAMLRQTAEEIRAIKKRLGPRFSDAFEIKWTKISPAGLPLYLALVDYFFDQPELAFRAVIVPDKACLRHEDFNQDHDTFYYKMLFQLLHALLRPDHDNRIYLDIKDTRSAVKMNTLHDVLCAANFDHIREVVTRVQTVRSHEVEHLQLADLLLGAVSYANRELSGSLAKAAVLARIRERSGLSLTSSSLVREPKCNIFRWRPQ